jgi:DNA-binding beta-propeller fold protein YncE
MNEFRSAVGQIPTGRAPSGVAFDAQGFLYYVDSPFSGGGGYLGRLVRVDVTTGTQTVVHSGLQFPADVEFLPDGSY